MKTKSLLIAGLLIAGITVQAQSVTYIVGENTETKIITDLAPFTLKNATSITLTGEWTNGHMAGLKNAFQTDASTEGNKNLLTLDMSAVTFTDYLFLPDYFSGCTSLSTIKMPETAVTIPVDFSGTFSKCPITSINLRQFFNVSNFHGIFKNCTELTTVKLPATTTSTEEISFNTAFNNCPKLTSPIDLSGFERLKGIELAFAACPLLPSITLGKDLTSVNDWDNAFLGKSKDFCIYINAAEADCNLGDMPENYIDLVKFVDPTNITNSTTDADFTLVGGKGSVIITAETTQTAQVVAVDGRMVRTISLNAGETQTLGGLAAGLYIVKGQKVLVY